MRESAACAHALLAGIRLSRLVASLVPAEVLDQMLLDVWLENPLPGAILSSVADVRRSPAPGEAAFVARPFAHSSHFCLLVVWDFSATIFDSAPNYNTVARDAIVQKILPQDCAHHVFFFIFFCGGSLLVLIFVFVSYIVVAPPPRSTVPPLHSKDTQRKVATSLVCGRLQAIQNKLENNETRTNKTK